MIRFCKQNEQINLGVPTPQVMTVGMFDIPKISVLKPISVYRYEFFSHTDIPKFLIYRNFSVYFIKCIHHAYGEIINFCFTQMQS